MRGRNKKKEKKQEEKTIIRISFKSKDNKKVFFAENKEDATIRENGRAAASNKSKMNRRRQKAEAVQLEATDTCTMSAEHSGSKQQGLASASKRSITGKDNVHCLTEEHEINEFDRKT